MQTINLRAGQTSPAQPLGVGSIATIQANNNIATWSGYFEYTFASPQQIENNTATWTTWTNGTVTATTSRTALYPMFARAVCLTGQVQAVFGDPTGSTSIQSIPWDSTLSLVTPAGVLAGDVVPTTTWANRPLPVTAYPNATIRITDVGGNTGAGGGNFFYTNATRWKPSSSSILLDSVDTPNTSVANVTEQNLNGNHIIIPAGVIGVAGDRLRIRMTLTKSAGVDSATIRVRFGPLGTIADPILLTIASLATTALSMGVVVDFKRVSATSVQKQGSASTDNPYGGASIGAFPAAVAVSDMDATAMYLSITSQMAAGTETVTLQDYTLEFWPTDSA